VEIWYEVALLIIVYVFILFIIGISKGDNGIMDIAWGVLSPYTVLPITRNPLYGN